MIDASNENTNYVAPGIQHKYKTIIAVMVSKDCVEECNWCFRRRLFAGDEYDNDEIASIDTVIDYIQDTPSVDSVLLTGGDSLLADHSYIHELITKLSKIPQINTIRLGTRALVLEPFKHIYRLSWLSSITRLDVMLHTVKAKELSGLADDFFQNNAKTMRFYSQTPLLNGYNQMPDAIINLMLEHVRLNINPYYVFQCRAIEGNERSSLSFEEGLHTIAVAQSQLNGLAKRFRYIMSCDEGKLEILGIQGTDVILRYHQAKEILNTGKIIRLPKHAVWYANKEPIFVSQGKYTTDPGASLRDMREVCERGLWSVSIW